MAALYAVSAAGILASFGVSLLILSSVLLILVSRLGTGLVAALADAGLTAYHAAAKAARLLRPGNYCVMIGAGGLGHIGIQVMNAISASTLIVIDRNPDALQLATDVGATTRC